MTYRHVKGQDKSSSSKCKTIATNSVLFVWLLFSWGTVDMQTCQTQKRPAESCGWEMSKDKYGPLIHSLTLASISLYLSAVIAPEDTEAWELPRKEQPFIFVRLSLILPPCYEFLFSLSLHLTPFCRFLLLSFAVTLISLAYSLRASLRPCMITENCMETVQELHRERTRPLADLHSTPTHDWPRAST